MLVRDQDPIQRWEGVEVESPWREDTSNRSSVAEAFSQKGIHQEACRARLKQPALVTEKRHIEHRETNATVGWRRRHGWR
jgi:hypothetical protein